MEIEGNRKIEGFSGLRTEFGACVCLHDRLCRQYRHSFDIPRHRDQVSLALYRIQSTQQELPEAHHLFDDAKYRLDCLLALAIEFAPFNRFEPVLHSVHSAGRFGQWGRLGESVLPMWMVPP